MANTAKFSIFYKARVVKAIVSGSRTLHALGFLSTGKTTPSSITNSHLATSATSTTFGSLASGDIPFGGSPSVYATVGAQISNSGNSDQLTIAAGSVVHAIALSDGGSPEKVIAYVFLTNVEVDYYYEEQGTLTIPSGGYTVRHA